MIDALNKAGPAGKGKKGAKAQPQVAKRDGKQPKPSSRGQAAATKDKKAAILDPDSLESKIGSVIRPSKEGKFNEKLHQARKDISEYIKTVILEHMVEAAFCYGESLEVSRTIQRKYENRPVNKFLFPMVKEFEYQMHGVLPKSLQTLSSLG